MKKLIKNQTSLKLIVFFTFVATSVLYLQYFKDGSIKVSKSFGIWNPSKWDTCSKYIHDSYSVIGPNGKKYPTWHPPVDPQTDCTFGHEHGRDPKDSDLYGFIKNHYAFADDISKSGIPFGYANEMLDVYHTDTGKYSLRHEDHVGHKIDWVNNFKLQYLDESQPNPDFIAGEDTGIICDVLTKIHQGTHSPDAFSNHAHEIFYFIECSEGTKMGISMISLLGKGGELGRFKQEQTSSHKLNLPDNTNASRTITTKQMIENNILTDTNLESWILDDWYTRNLINTSENKMIALFDPYFTVFDPARYYDKEKPNGYAHTIELCKDPTFSSKMNGQCKDVPYDSPESPFKGVIRQTSFLHHIIDNENGPTTWYTDPLGNNAVTDPFAGSIKQYISPVHNNFFGFDAQIFRGDFSAKGIHAPN